ncbi:MAG: hypothetical protein H7318_15690 [Oligoflexus sp.]|nr:hypothetical protein [Oligoflexus sp.]
MKTNTIRQHNLRLQAIDDLNTPLFTLSLNIRLAKDLKLISLNRHAELIEILLDIKRQLSGWKRWTQKQVDAG